VVLTYTSASGSSRHHCLCIWLYHRFNLNHHDIEDLLAERGSLLVVRLSGFGDTFCNDEVFISINGKRQYLRRAADQDGEVVDVYLQVKRDGAVAKRFCANY
jgi:putative transposase